MDIISLAVAAIGIGVTAYTSEQSRKAQAAAEKQAEIASAQQSGQVATLVKNAAVTATIAALVYAAATIILKD